jgi:hypothetical protein
MRVQTVYYKLGRQFLYLWARALRSASAPCRVFVLRTIPKLCCCYWGVAHDLTHSDCITMAGNVESIQNAWEERRATFGLTGDRIDTVDRRNKTLEIREHLSLSCCENSLAIQLFSSRRPCQFEMYWSESLTGKHITPPPTNCGLGAGFSMALYAFRPSYVIRTWEVYICYICFSPFAVCCICMYVECACVKCVLSPYQIAALTIQLRNNIGSNKRVALAAATSGRGATY